MTDVVYETAREEKGTRPRKHENVEIAIDSLSYGRLKKLFDLWDVDCDGDITFAELMVGLQTFQNAADIAGDAIKEAREVLRSFDENGDERLDPREFAQAMVHYAKKIGIAVHDLIDFMCVTHVVGDDKDSQGFQHAFGKSLSSVNAIPDRPRQTHFTGEDDFELDDCF